MIDVAAPLPLRKPRVESTRPSRSGNHVLAAGPLLVTLAAASCSAGNAVKKFIRCTLWTGSTAEHESFECAHDEHTGGGAIGDSNNDGWLHLDVTDAGPVGAPAQARLTRGRRRAR